MRKLDERVERAMGPRIRTPANVQRKWERDAAEMRARIEQGKPAIEEKKK